MRALVVMLLVAVAGCSEDDPTAGSAASGAGGHAGGGGSPTGGGAAAGGGGHASGGSGGAAWIDPIAGIGAVEEVAGGFEFTEGPAWFAASGKLYFTDIPASRIYELTPPAAVAIFREPSGNANGLGVDQDGLLVACEHGNRRVTRTTSTAQIVVVADGWEGKKLNSPNDVVVRSDGTLYFTDPPYGGHSNELGFQGIFRVGPGGAMTLVADDMFRPNGIALSPDEKVLYVGDSEESYVRRYEVAADGTAASPKKLVDTASTPDGMAVDVQGDLFVTTAAGVETYRADGVLVGTIPVPEQPSNCTFGGSDGKTLYITARSSLYRVTVNVAGLP
jgi:gluconolactonase